MDKFNEWFDSEYPQFSENQDNDFCKTAKDFSFKAWQSRQAEVDELAEHKQTLLQEVDGHMHQFNVLSKDVEEKDKRIEEALFQMRQQALSLKEDCDGYKDPVCICQSEGVDWCVRFLEKALRGEHE